jgi:hypothetical protein
MVVEVEEAVVGYGELRGGGSVGAGGGAHVLIGGLWTKVFHTVQG